MENILEKFDSILVDTDKSINEKILGINYLELLKYNIIEKIKEVDNKILKNIKEELAKEKVIEKEIRLNNREIKYRFEYYEKALSSIKQKKKNDFLIIIIEGSKSITIYDNNIETKTMYADLSVNMGIVVSIDTVITSKIANKSIILSISFN